MQKVLWVVGVVLVALVGAWWWGAHGRWTVERTQQGSELRQELLEGRSAVLDARLDLYNVNFGEASRHLEMSKNLLHSADDRLKALGRGDDAKQVETALLRIDDAQRMAGTLDQGANSRAAEAAKILADVLEAAKR
jgi:hypothetical protein